MKKVTLILGIILLSNIVFAQYSKSYNPPKGWGSIELYLPASILVSTFTINQSVLMSMRTRNQIAITGICTSMITHDYMQSSEH
jgi:O-antigen/teichoic acid export membrane protein